MDTEPVAPQTSKKSILLVATFAAFLTPFLGSAVNLALPAIGKDLNANAISLGWVISSFILSSAIFLLPFGRLADIIGRKNRNLTIYSFYLSYHFYT
jgi:MFS family permease